MHDKSVTELRKMLKEHRSKTHSPVGKMKKHEVIAELEKHMGKSEAVVHHEAKPEVSVKVSEKKSEKKASAPITKDLPAKIGKAPKPDAGGMQKVATEEKKVPKVRLMKGSQEARDYMAKIRMMRKKKDE